MRKVAPLVAVPFLLAVVGVLLMVGLVVEHGLGRIALSVYVVVVVAPAVAGLVVAARRRSRAAVGRTCTCCTGTVHDPVQVI